MRVAVSFDENGNIVTMFDPDKLSGETTFAAYNPAEGENHHIFEVPSGVTYSEIPQAFRVTSESGQPKLERRG